MAKDYRVQLEVYNGPLDLLLYLIKRDELNIYDIPISRITEQFLRYIEVIQLLDLGVAGDFLVMASTLMEIKARMLLPRPEVLPEGEEEDPRMELVRQLIEYKRFKDAAGDLADFAEERRRRFERLGEPLPEQEQAAGPGNSLKDVDLWVLIDAFQRLMKQTMADVATRIVYDDTPIHVYAQHLLERLRAAGSLLFIELFQPAKNRSMIIGIFLALLELIKQRKLRIEETGTPGEIRIVFVEPPAPAPPLPSPPAPAPAPPTPPAAKGEKKI
ncbi:MAG: chromosome segregation protein ScpA [Planctomycetes bacterium]|nr:chromosome segregation protein ScpA [Planctomycetota bacterium]